MTRGKLNFYLNDLHSGTSMRCYILSIIFFSYRDQPNQEVGVVSTNSTELSYQCFLWLLNKYTLFYKRGKKGKLCLFSCEYLTKIKSQFFRYFVCDYYKTYRKIFIISCKSNHTSVDRLNIKNIIKCQYYKIHYWSYKKVQ